MTTTHFISVRETAQLLGISEKAVMDLIETRKLQAYRIAEKFLRLKKNDVLGIRNAGSVKRDSEEIQYTTSERLQDFFYFNDFYIACSVLICVLIYIIFYT